MSIPSFAFKQFVVRQDKSAMKVGTDAVLLGSWTDTISSQRILDIGTGTGVIALMLAQRSYAFIDAIDIDENCCEEARLNVRESKWSDRIHIHHLSFQSFADQVLEPYDLIVSNPPFFSDCSKASFIERTTARHTDLLSFEELAGGVSRLLSASGRFCLILPQKESELFRDVAAAHKLHLAKITRVRTTPEKATEKRVLMQFQRKPKCFQEDSITIEEGGRHSYTDDYKKLTKEFYLAF